jgi:choline dehydrogenase-like flavoprotein
LHNPESTVGRGDLVTDLCIVGAGPAGITIARELNRSGVRVCLLESGGAEVESRVQRQSRGESNGYPIHLLHQSRVRAFGGTLRHPDFLKWGWAARPLDQIDFQERVGVPQSGWPFDRSHLNPYYKRAHEICELPLNDFKTDGKSADPRKESCPFQSEEIEPTFFQFSEMLFDQARDTLLNSSNVQVLLNSRAVEIATDAGGGRVETITAVREDRSRVVVRPRVVVIATGGIENARLLLTADGGRGLGNEHDLVGRYFAERMSMPVGYVLFAGSHSVEDGAFFDRRGGLSGAVRVVDHVQQERNLLNCSFALAPRPVADTTRAVRSLSTVRKAVSRRPLVRGLGRHVRNVTTGLDDVSDFVLSHVVTRRRAAVLRVQGEQAPNRDSRVSLGSRRDEMGVPLARVTWRMTDADYQALRTSVEIVDTAMRSSGFGSVQSTLDKDPATLIEGNHHHLGATRMHSDSRSGVVDADCRVHSVENLYVAGCSVFPTYGLSNPTLTIVALALRLADYLRKQ